MRKKALEQLETMPFATDSEDPSVQFAGRQLEEVFNISNELLAGLKTPIVEDFKRANPDFAAGYRKLFDFYMSN